MARDRFCAAGSRREIKRFPKAGTGWHQIHPSFRAALHFFKLLFELCHLFETFWRRRFGCGPGIARHNN